MTDANGNSMVYVFDLSDRLIETRYPDGTSSSTAYDVRGRKVSATDQAARENNTNARKEIANEPRSANSKALREVFNKLDFCPN